MTYLDDCPNWDDMKTLKRIIIPLLKNGSLLKASRCDNNFMVIRETCAFDSLTQIIINAIVVNETYHNIIINENNIFCNFAKNISIINNIKITSNIYQERARILSNVPIFKMQPYRTIAFKCNLQCRAFSGIFIRKFSKFIYKQKMPSLRSRAFVKSSSNQH